jgi:hypothetical protein
VFSKVSTLESGFVFVGVVWTGGQNGKKSLHAFKMKTASCGLGPSVVLVSERKFGREGANEVLEKRTVELV